MNLLKQYITQVISSASNDLRLSTEKIEIVALLRQSINQSADLQEDLKKMKTITELSKLAIKLNEIFNFLSKEQVDFRKLSEKFREHSQYLIKDISQMLDTVSPGSFKILLDKIPGSRDQHPEKKEEAASAETHAVQKEMPGTEKTIFAVTTKNNAKDNVNSGKQKDFGEKILRTIRPLDDFLKKIGTGSLDPESIDMYLNILKENGTISTREGYGTVARMHENICSALELIKSGEFMPTRDAAESMRACLIVIATLIKNKEVDIKSYINLADEFGKKIETIKQDKS